MLIVIVCEVEERTGRAHIKAQGHRMVRGPNECKNVMDVRVLF